MNRVNVAFFILRVGLALTFVYAGVDFLRQPEAWVGWLPEWLKRLSPLKDEPLLYTIGVAHILLSAFLFISKYARVASTLLVLYLLGILLTSSPASWIIVFRDIGLLAAAIALSIAPRKASESRVATHALHVGAICLRDAPNGGVEVLAGRRSPLKRHYQGFWEGSAGGAMHEHEDFAMAAARHLREDYGVEANILAPVAPFEIPASGGDPRILGIKFLSTFLRYTNGSGVVLDESEYSQWRWVPGSEVDSLRWIPGAPRNAKEDVLEAIAMYRRLKTGTPE